MMRRFVFGLVVAALFALLPAAPALASGYEARAQIVYFAMAQVGKPYSMDLDKRLGPNYYDCSGLCYMAYSHAGVYISNSILDFVAYPISEAELLPGDTVWQGYETRPGYEFPTGYHVGLYIGNGEVIHASSRRGVVREPLHAVPWDWYGRIPAYNWPDGDNSCAYAVNQGDIDTPDRMIGGRTYNATIRLQNKGTLTWRTGGANPVYVTSHWQNRSTGAVFDSVPTPKVRLPADAPFNSQIFANVQVVAPVEPGEYLLKYDLLHEGVGLFSTFFCKTLDIPVTVLPPMEYGDEPVVSVGAAELSGYTGGSDVRFRAGTLVKGSSSSVYVTEYLSGLYFRRVFPSAAVFDDLGYNWSDIITLSDADINGYIVGSSVTPGVHANGALIKTSTSPAVCVLDNLQKRPVSYASFIANDFRWDRIFTVSDSEMAIYATGAVFPMRAGTLVKGGSSVIYVTDINGSSPARRAITSAAIFNSLGYRWEDIMTVSDGELSSYTEGAPVSSSATHPNGAIVRNAADPDSVYLIEGGMKRKLAKYLYTDPYISAFVSGFESSELSTVVKGSTINLPVTLKNNGYLPWPAAVTSLSYQWIDVWSGTVTNGVTTAIGSDIPSGGSANLTATVVAPAATGTYVLKWDVLKDGGWLSASGSPAAYYATTTARPKYPDGRLVKTASAPDVYLIDQGKKRPVTSGTVFSSNGFRWDRIHTVTATELAQYTMGDLCQARPGTLIKGSSSAVYISDFSGGVQTKRAIGSAAVFTSLGLRWEDVRQLTDAEVSSYENVPSLDSAATHPNGMLVKVSGADAVYFLDQDKKRPIASGATFNSNALRWDRVVTISTSEMNGYEPGPTLQAAPGSLIKSPNSSTVYVSDINAGGTYEKRPINSITAFNALGLNFADLYVVPDSELGGYNNGAALE